MPEEKKARKNFPVKRLAIAAGCVLLAVMFALLAAFLPPERLLPAKKISVCAEGEARLHFIDVGQGDCTAVEFSNGDVLVVDAGDGSFRTRNALVRYLKGLSPARLSVLATHSDADHVGGFPALFNAFEVDECFLPAYAGENAEYTAFLRAAEEEGCRAETLSRYGAIERENGYLVCLSPRTAEEESENNETSAVLYGELNGVRFVLGADIGAGREELLLQEYALGVFDVGRHAVRLEEIDVLKASHHGSGNASSAAWLGLLRPAVFVLSCGRGNLYGHPDGETLARFRAASPQGQIFRTDELGNIVVSMRSGTYTVWEE